MFSVITIIHIQICKVMRMMFVFFGSFKRSLRFIDPLN